MIQIVKYSRNNNLPDDADIEHLPLINYWIYLPTDYIQILENTQNLFNTMLCCMAYNVSDKW